MSDVRAEAVVRAGLQKALVQIRASADALGQLDAAAGDGDHGDAMVRGLVAANAAIADVEGATAGALLMQAGAAFGDASGGASGALFGALLSTVGQKLGDGPFMTATVWTAMQAGTDTVCKLGKTKVGDKTMVDALAPFVDAMAISAAAQRALIDAWPPALAAAEAATEATAQIVARRGRSSRLGERSLGHCDPGAVSVCFLLRAFGEALDEICNEENMQKG